MTESEWLTLDDPTPMLVFLRGRASERKLRLFTIACARLLWDRIPSGELREAVEAADRCAEGTPWDEELAGFCRRLYAQIGDYRRATGRNWFTDHPREQLGIYFTVLRTTAAECGLQTTVASPHSVKAPSILPLTGSRQPDLIRDIFGNPFRPTTADPNWLTPRVQTLARAIHDGRDFSAMPTVADFLEEAGCGLFQHAILSHCRGGGPHVRGCWVVDLVLGKE